MKKLGNSVWAKRLLLVCYDIVAVIASSYVALLSRFDFNPTTIPSVYLNTAMRALPGMIVITLLVFAVLRLYNSLWSYAGGTEFMYMICACVVDAFLGMIYVLWTNHSLVYPLPRSYYVYFAIALIIFTAISRYSYRIIRSIANRRVNAATRKRVLVVGAGEAGNALIKEISISNYIDMNVVGVIDDDHKKQGSYIHGVKVVGDRYDIEEAVKNLDVKEIIIAIPTAAPKEMKEILDICKRTGCELKRLPGMYQLVNGEVSVSKLKDVDVNDLLGREPIQINTEEVLNYVGGKTVLITGGGGSIGSELCRQVASHHPKQLIILDIYENGVYDIQQELIRKYPDLNLEVLIASVRNTNRINDIFSTFRPDIVYHAAAHKHVPLMEISPNEAIKNNVMGTYKTAKAADRYGTEKFVLISTDKAVNPTNVMGASKRICEMIIQMMNQKSATNFVAVRFGNVLGSNGSVIPLFKKQIAEGGPVTVTHKDMVRYFMTIPEAVSLVLQAGAYARGGEIFVLDMGKPVKILDLATNLIKLSGYRVGEDIEIKFTGLRPGEKMYEELLMDEEGLKKTANKMIFIGKPIEFDAEIFERQLDRLIADARKEDKDIRRDIKEIVETYQYED